MKTVRRPISLAIVGMAFTFWVFSACSLVPAGTNGARSQTVDLHFSIKVPPAQASSQNRIGIAKSEAGTGVSANQAPRVLFPQTSNINVRISGEALETPFSQDFKKNVSTGTFEISISDIPVGLVEIDIVAGVDTGDPAIYDGLSSAHTSVELVRGPNVINLGLEPVEDKLAGTLKVGESLDGMPITPQYGKSRFFKLLPAQGDTVAAGGYSILQTIQGLGGTIDENLIKVYDYHGSEIADGRFETGAVDLGTEAGRFINAEAGNKALYVGVFFPAGAQSISSTDASYGIKFDRGVLAFPANLDETTNASIDDQSPVTVAFTAPVRIGNLQVGNADASVISPSPNPISSVSPSLSADGRSLALTPGTGQGWQLGSATRFFVDGLTDMDGQTIAVYASRTSYKVGRVFYVDPAGGTYTGAQSDPNTAAGRRGSPFKYLDDLLASTGTGWFSGNNAIILVKVEGYPYNGADTYSVLSGAGATVSLGSSAFAGLKIQGGYNPAAWDSIPDTLTRPSLISADISDGSPVVLISAGGVDISGFRIKRTPVTDTTASNVMIRVDGGSFSPIADVRIHDNIVEQSALASGIPANTKVLSLQIYNANFAVYRNSFVGAAHQIDTSKGGVYSFETGGIEVSQKYFAMGVIANNVIESGAFSLNASGGSTPFKLTGISSQNSASGAFGALVIANNTIVTGGVQGSASGDADIQQSSAIRLTDTYASGFAGLVSIANNVLARRSGVAENTSAIANAAIYAEPNVLSYETAHIANNVFSNWDGYLFANSSSTVTADYNTINGISGSYGSNRSGSNGASTFLLQTGDPKVNNPGSDMVSYVPGGYKLLSSATSADNGVSIGGGGIDFGYYDGNGSGFLQLFTKDAAKSASGYQFGSAFGAYSGFLELLSVDRLGTPRTGNGSSGWSIGAYETD